MTMCSHWRQATKLGKPVSFRSGGLVDGGSIPGTNTSTSSRLILSESINRLMQSTLALNSNTKLVKRSGLGWGTIGRVRNAEAAATMDTLDRLAECFGVRPWQLLKSQDVTQLPPAEQPLVCFQPAMPPQPGIQPSSTAQELGVLFDLLTDRDGKVDRAEVFTAAVEAISRAVTGRQV